jgi:hypothetical protein
MAKGPKNATTYRLCSANGDMARFDIPGLPDLLDGSIGTEEMGTETGVNGRKGKKMFKYGQEHAYSIQGVAWYVDESIC